MSFSEDRWFEMRYTTVLTSKGQVTLPKKVRQDLGLQAQDKFLVLVYGGAILLIPLPREGLLSLFGALPVSESHTLSELREAYRQQRGQSLEARARTREKG